MDKLRNVYATRDERAWWVQLATWLGMMAICSPAGVAALLFAIAHDQAPRALQDEFAMSGLFVLVTFLACSFAVAAATAINPLFNTARPDVGEFAKALAIAPFWVLASGPRLAIGLLIGAGIVGLFLLGIRAL